jgi:hypothetical protein
MHSLRAQTPGDLFLPAATAPDIGAVPGQASARRALPWERLVALGGEAS